MSSADRLLNQFSLFRLYSLTKPNFRSRLSIKILNILLESELCLVKELIFKTRLLFWETTLDILTFQCPQGLKPLSGLLEEIFIALWGFVLPSLFPKTDLNRSLSCFLYLRYYATLAHQMIYSLCFSVLCDLESCVDLHADFSLWQNSPCYLSDRTVSQL